MCEGRGAGGERRETFSEARVGDDGHENDFSFLHSPTGKEKIWKQICVTCCQELTDG